jgi:WD40 repeat protein
MTRALITNEWHTFLYQVDSDSVVAERPGYALGFSEDSNELIWFDDTQATLNFTSLTNASFLKHIRLDLTETEFPVKQVSENGRWFFCVDRNGKAGIWTTRGEGIASFPVLQPPIRTARMSPDGRWLAIAVEREYDVHLYRIPGGDLTRLKGHRDHVTGIDFSPASDLIATGSVDAEVRIFNVLTGQVVSQLSGHLEEASGVTFSPDGRTLASIGTHSALKIWHVPTGREVISLPMPMAGFHATFSPDGRRLAVSRHDQVLEMLQAP